MFLMRHPFLVIFAIALLESMVMAKVGTYLGWGMTIGLILLGMVLGSMLMRRQGFQTFRRLQIAMARGENPGPEILEGVMIMAGGLMLMMPGFISDVFGCIFLTPFLRRGLVSLLLRRLASLPLSANVVQEQWTYDYRAGDFRSEQARPGQHYGAGGSYGEIYEGERVDTPVTRPVREEERVEILITTRTTDASANSETRNASNVIEGEFRRKEE